MEHPLLFPLLDVLASERRTDPEDLSAANVVAWRLLNGAYLGDTYRSWHLAETAPDEWRLMQVWREDELLERDVMEPFYADPYAEDWGDDESKDDDGVGRVSPSVFEVEARARSFDPPRLTEGEHGVSAEVSARADALLERVRSRHPAAVDRLLRPTMPQVHRRHAIQIDVVNGEDLYDFLQPLIGIRGDSSLRTFGIEYHTSPSWLQSSDLYFVAHNGEEVAGLMRVGMGTEGRWSYALSYVSVAPGFRGQGLSRRLYETGLARCVADGRVWVRSNPGKATPPKATAAYDRLLKETPVLHTVCDGPLCGSLERCVKTGRPYAELLAALKPACDDVVPSRAERMAGVSRCLDWAENEAQREKHAAAFDAVLSPAAATARKPRC